MLNKPERQDRWDWIAEEMKNRLEHVLDFSIGIINKSGNYIGANNRVGQEKWGIEFVHIRSVDDDKQDGDRFLSVRGTPEVDLYPAKRVQGLKLGPGRDVKRSDTFPDVDIKKLKLSTSGVVDDTNQPGMSGTGGGSSSTRQLARVVADSRQQKTSKRIFAQTLDNEDESNESGTDDSGTDTEVEKTSNDASYIVYSSDSGVETALQLSHAWRKHQSGPSQLDTRLFSG
ncbi:hypothetical protein HD806DRAFT_540808 [Xylariaceae sp. AK1471]|nr:hypothetical protein HD806DRAFT_540808 [Xylariaceae sp. AK1471]